MIRIDDRSKCCGCSACADSCPHSAIRMQADGMGFKYPAVDEDKCIDCGICDSVCAFKPAEKNELMSSEAIRFPSFLDKSQSGGLGFALMRKAVLEGRIVYGAAMEKDFTVRHIRVMEESALGPLRLSKYVQSDMTGVPSMVLEDLAAGRKVLFTGTPCQCAGIASIAGKYRGQLLLADIICHGVPGPYIWRDYINNQEKQRGKVVTKAFFRDPSLGWHEAREALFFGEEIVISDEYTHLYYKRIMMRPSCYSCPFASLNRPSDITMGDCWGVEKALPGFADDNRGCSLLITHTEMGKDFTSFFPDDSVREELPVSKILQLNLYETTKPHKDTELFKNIYIRKGYESVIRRFGKNSLRYRLKEFIKKVRRHI